MMHRRRALWVTTVFALAFTGISLKLVQVQLAQHEKYRRLALENHGVKQQLPARRGGVVDAQGRMLIQTQFLYDVRLDAKILDEEKRDVARLAEVMGLRENDLRARINPLKRDQILLSKVDDNLVTRLKALKIRGLIYQSLPVRVYPNFAHASHVLGYLNENGNGAMGVEKSMDRYLRGISGERWIEKDRKGREIAVYRGAEIPAKDGYQVMLTVDLAIQHIVEDQLDKLVEKYRPLGVYSIVMRPRTGEILAMGNRPTFDPNKREEFSRLEALRNRCITDQVEPGSIFKIVTTAAVLNEGLFSLDDTIFCENGKFFYAGYWLHDHQPYGILTVRQILQVSSNPGTVKMALELGADKLFAYAQAFGFGRATGLLPGQAESAGVLRPVSTWSKVSVARIPIGQGVAASPLQMINALCAIANGGRLMQPQLIKRLDDEEGHPVQLMMPKVLRQVISPKTAAGVTEAMTKVVGEGGTAPKAEIPGYDAAGKTGTAQKVVNGQYSKEKYVASFMGFFPAQNPEVAILVMVDEPQGKEYYGGQVAAPAFAEIGAQIAQYLNIPPTKKRETAEEPQRAAL
jgi:cell division protein FtsI (penicillin-binding protein 3)/stage V sporulation protein D (sporulation-specific penicillin-binding protein)